MHGEKPCTKLSWLKADNSTYSKPTSSERSSTPVNGLRDPRSFRYFRWGRVSVMMFVKEVEDAKPEVAEELADTAERVSNPDGDRTDSAGTESSF